ncbi:hypothetical protein MMPV_008815 [Pyropia vietnamensis]
MGAPPAGVVGPAGTYLPPLRRPAAATQLPLSHAAIARPSLYSSRLPTAAAARPEQANGLALDASGASAGWYHRPADGLDPSAGLTPPFTPTTVAPRPPPPSAWRSDGWRTAPACGTAAPGAEMYSCAPVPPALGRSARGPPSSAVGGSSMKRVGAPAEHPPSWPHGPTYGSDLPEYAPPVPPRHHALVPALPAAMAPQLWSPAPAVPPVMPAQPDAPAPRTDADLFSLPSSRGLAGHVAGPLRCPTLPALPPPRAGWTPQQRQEQELEELLSSQGDTEQLQGTPMGSLPQVPPHPPVTRPSPPLAAPLTSGVNVSTPHPRAARQPWWSNPPASYDEQHPAPPVALGLPTLSTTTSGGSAHNGVDQKVGGSNPASGMLGVVSYLTAPGAVGGYGSGGSSRRAITDDSCAVDSMRQRSSSDTCLSAGGVAMPPAVADAAYTPPVAAQSPPPAAYPLSRQRVSWTFDLRRRFEKALETTGGIDSATPTAVLDAMTAAADADGVVLPLSRQNVASFLQRQRKRRRDVAAAAAASAEGEGARACGGHAPDGGVLAAADAMPSVSAAGLSRGCGTPYQTFPVA